MKKIGYLLLLFLFLFIGVVISPLDNNSKNELLQEELKEFENQIILPNNNYQGIENNKIEPNILGNVGEKIEGVIDKAIDKAKDVLKKIVD